jgi:hypothetical protein
VDEADAFDACHPPYEFGALRLVLKIARERDVASGDVNLHGKTAEVHGFGCGGDPVFDGFRVIFHGPVAKTGHPNEEQTPAQDSFHLQTHPVVSPEGRNPERWMGMGNFFSIPQADRTVAMVGLGREVKLAFLW